MKRVMVVDDEENLIEIVTKLLEREKIGVIPAHNGTECLDKLKKAKPDLILLDMFMPGISGRETCEKIRGNPKTKDIKIIFLTVALFSGAGKDILKDMNVSDYITKPFDNKDLVKRVKKVLQ
jgi:CheY-like chemotaxis protein